jgi:peptidyl-tRNA hydrolase, PTH1 family
MFCVVGLGNPGEKYRATRHNLGFRVADELAERCNTRIRRREFQALTAVARIGRSEVLLLKPQTYMNLCGRSVIAACGTLGIPPDRLIVAYDDADLGLGRLRVRSGGGTGGHLGVRSIVEETGAADFARVRLGVGRPPAAPDLASWVLEEPRGADALEIDALVERGAAAVWELIVNGVAAAMQKFNAASRPQPPEPE